MGDSYIIAIDFGTAYSGYAYSMTSREKESDPILKRWGENVGLDTPKTPTCILFDEKKKFISFGYEAKDAYLRLDSEDSKKKFFFDCFKMSLYETKLNRHKSIKAANGRSMNALEVFSEALRYLKEDALKSISANTHGSNFKESDFTWVLTVPAIWGSSAKQFMRIAATQAGIVTEKNGNKLVIALEPEAASIWCKKLPKQGFIAENHGEVRLGQTSGTKYIVVDCGGGTIDITVHEVLDGGALKELHKASGNDLGGQTVDRKFKEFLREIFCDGVWDEFEGNYPSELQRTMNYFMQFKKHDDDVVISCPFNLGNIAFNKGGIEKFFKSVRGASWDDGSIKISKEKLKAFFDQSLKGITDLLNKIFITNPYLKNINFILLVGGYAESKILRQHVADYVIHSHHFNQSCDKPAVLCPCRPQEAIMKGAVEFGRNPAVVASRKSAFTYGLCVSEKFNESKHKAGKRFTNTGGVWCNDIFMKLVTVNQDVGYNEINPYNLFPIYPEQTRISHTFYQVDETNPDPKYVDEEGVEKIGSFVAKSPVTTRGMDRVIKLNMKFGFTEMSATATDVDSGLTESIMLEFMTK